MRRVAYLTEVAGLGMAVTISGRRSAVLHTLLKQAQHSTATFGSPSHPFEATCQISPFLSRYLKLLPTDPDVEGTATQALTHS